MSKKAEKKRQEAIQVLNQLIERYTLKNNFLKFLTTEVDQFKKQISDLACEHPDAFDEEGEWALSQGVLKVVANAPKLIDTETGKSLDKAIRLKFASKLPDEYLVADVDLVLLLRSAHEHKPIVDLLNDNGLAIEQTNRIDIKPVRAKKEVVR